MMIKLLSDTALVISVADAPGKSALTDIHSLVEKLGQLAGLNYQEIVPGLTAVAVHLRPEADVMTTWELLEEQLPTLAKRRIKRAKARERIIPVVYGSDYGPDLRRVADHTGLSVEGVIKRHASGVYQVMALGFAPGFPYLSGLHSALACPRLDTPRLRVPAGAVGIGGAQTGVYPQELPGGWNIIGRTSQRLFDPEAKEPAWLRVGDRVRFRRIDAPVIEIETDPRPPQSTAVSVSDVTEDVIEVEDGGVQTSVQDLGRPGYQAIGVAEGGALDKHALSIANLMVGNEVGAPALEWALKGPVLRFQNDTLVALTGAEVAGRPSRASFLVEAGEQLDLSQPTRGGRGYLAVRGGFCVPLTLGSASTHFPAGFGGFDGRALRAGDRLPIGTTSKLAVTAGWQPSDSFRPPPPETTVEVRVLPGPEWTALHASMWERLITAEYRVSPDSDRMGFRLQGPVIELKAPLEMVSQPVCLGTVQMPPDGQPVVLMADRQSVGGYPRVATVIAADIPILAQVPLGGNVRFVEVSLPEAQLARWQQRRDLGLLKVGLRQRFIKRS